MKVCLLSSGSIGNAIVIEGEDTAILVDCGLTFKKFDALMHEAGLNTAKLKHLLVTHEHSDHVRGVGICARRLNLEMWATETTIDKLYSKNILREDDAEPYFVEKYTAYQIDEFTVTPFPLSHDAVDPVGFIIEHAEKKVVLLTDTGYVSRDVMQHIKDADLYILETNHNVEMLHMCNRPWELKQRILGDYGHLSNEEGAHVLCKLAGDKTKHVFLSHLSQEANLPDLALMTVKDILKDHNVKGLNIHMTYPMSPSSVVKI